MVDPTIIKTEIKLVKKMSPTSLRLIFLSPDKTLALTANDDATVKQKTINKITNPLMVLSIEL